MKTSKIVVCVLFCFVLPCVFQSTRVALNHLESVPEKLNLLEDFRVFGNSHSQAEQSEKRYDAYKEIMGTLQQHLADSKRKLEYFGDKKTGSDISAIQSTSCNCRANTSFMTSSLLSNSGSFTKSALCLDSNAAKKDATSVTLNGMKLQTGREK
uniref:Uncharacterized protein n=1 Tax=Salvator merianae TaxID=96440 RepID=A0A8D0C8U8_SALMN